MATITLCTDTPVPTFKALSDALAEKITGALPELTIPNLPGLRSPIYDGFSQLGMEISQLVQELQAFQINLTLFNVFKPIADLLGGSLADLLPKIPHTDLTLIDIVAGEAAPIYAALQAAMEKGLTFPGIPSPLFPGLSVPGIESVNTVKAILRGYMADLVTKATDAINAACLVLTIPPMAAGPHIPTYDDVVAFILEVYPQVAKIEDLEQLGITVQEIFALLVFPGIPPLILPDPLLPGFSNFSIEMQEAMAIFRAHALTGPIGPIVDFCNDALGSLGFSFPTICISF